MNCTTFGGAHRVRGAAIVLSVLVAAALLSTLVSAGAATGGAALSISTNSPSNGASVSGMLTWQASASANVAQVDFFLDGTLSWSEDYAPWIFKYAIPPIGLCILVAFGLLLWKKPKHVLVWCIAPFILAHTFIGHKEVRFLYPLVDLVPWMLVAALAALRQQPSIHRLMRESTPWQDLLPARLSATLSVRVALFRKD